jgi:hypothetical protein
MAKPSKAGSGLSTSAPAATSSAGPSRPKGKVIPRTSDLLRRNESDKRKGKGKGKERDVLGGLMGMLDGESGWIDWIWRRPTFQVWVGTDQGRKEHAWDGPG